MPRIHLYWKLTSELHKADLYEELNLFGKSVLQELSAVDERKFIFQSILSEILPMLSQRINTVTSSSHCCINRKNLRKSKNYQKLFVILHLPRVGLGGAGIC